MKEIDTIKKLQNLADKLGAAIEEELGEYDEPVVDVRKTSDVMFINVFNRYTLGLSMGELGAVKKAVDEMLEKNDCILNMSIGVVSVCRGCSFFHAPSIDINIRIKK